MLDGDDEVLLLHVISQRVAEPTGKSIECSCRTGKSVLDNILLAAVTGSTKGGIN